MVTGQRTSEEEERGERKETRLVRRRGISGRRGRRDAHKEREGAGARVRVRGNLGPH